MSASSRTRNVHRPGHVRLPRLASSTRLTWSAHQLPRQRPTSRQLLYVHSLSLLGNLRLTAVPGVLYYDHLLTLPLEILYFWGTPLSMGNVLFFANRYFTFLSNLILVALRDPSVNSSVRRLHRCARPHALTATVASVHAVPARPPAFDHGCSGGRWQCARSSFHRAQTEA
jgi:hypothetical protein